MSGKTLKRGSDALFVLAVVLLVVALVADQSVLLAGAGAALAASVVLTSLKRRQDKAGRAAKATPRG